MENDKRYGHLTNEQISKRFKSQFDLVNHAIGLAAHFIHAGVAPSPGSADNIVNDVLKDIELGRDFYHDIDDEEDEEADERSTTFDTREEEESPPKKSRSRSKEALKK